MVSCSWNAPSFPLIQYWVIAQSFSPGNIPHCHAHPPGSLVGPPFVCRVAHTCTVMMMSHESIGTKVMHLEWELQILVHSPLSLVPCLHTVQLLIAYSVKIVILSHEWWPMSTHRKGRGPWLKNCILYMHSSFWTTSKFSASLTFGTQVLEQINTSGKGSMIFRIPPPLIPPFLHTVCDQKLD